MFFLVSFWEGGRGGERSSDLGFQEESMGGGRRIHEVMELDQKKGGQSRRKWQLNQSNETKTKNLENDFEELVARTD